MGIGCEYRVFTCVTAMKLINQTDVPTLFKTLMAVELQLVGFPVKVTLNHCSGMVDISGVFMPNMLHEERGCIW